MPPAPENGSLLFSGVNIESGQEGVIQLWNPENRWVNDVWGYTDDAMDTFDSCGGGKISYIVREWEDESFYYYEVEIGGKRIGVGQSKKGRAPFEFPMDLNNSHISDFITFIRFLV